MKRAGRRDLAHGQSPAVEGRDELLEDGDLGLRCRGEGASQRRRVGPQLGAGPRDGRPARALVLLVARELVRRLRGRLQPLGRLRGERRLLREDPLGVQRQLDIASLAGALRQQAAERDEVLLHAAPPGARIARRRAPEPFREQRLGLAPVRGPPEQLVEALEHVGRPDLGGEDLVGDGRQLVRFVDDGEREVRIVRRPAQQQVVVRDHQMGLRERRAAPAEGAAPLRRALLARAELGARRHRAAQQVAQRRIAEEHRRRQRPHLAPVPGARAGGERGVGEAILGKNARLAPLGEHLLDPPGADVVRAALHRERAQAPGSRAWRPPPGCPSRAADPGAAWCGSRSRPARGFRRPPAPSRRGWRPPDTRATSRRPCRPRAGACPRPRAAARRRAPSGSALRARGSPRSAGARARGRRAPRRWRPRRRGPALRRSRERARTARADLPAPRAARPRRRRARASRARSSRARRAPPRSAVRRGARPTRHAPPPARCRARRRARGVAPRRRAARGRRSRGAGPAHPGARSPAGPGCRRSERLWSSGETQRERKLCSNSALCATITRPSSAAVIALTSSSMPGAAATSSSLSPVRRCTARGSGPRGFSRLSSVVSRASPGSTSTRAELEDLGARVLCETGGLQVDERQRTHRRRQSRQRLGFDPELAGERRLDREGRRRTS